MIVAISNENWITTILTLLGFIIIVLIRIVWMLEKRITRLESMDEQRQRNGRR